MSILKPIHTTLTPDVQMITRFVFGSGFNTFINLLFTKMTEGGVIISDSDYRKYVDNSVMEMSIGIVDFFKEQSAQTNTPNCGPNKGNECGKTTSQQNATNTCIHVFVRGPRKGNTCGSCVKTGFEFCTVHSKKQKALVPHVENHELVEKHEVSPDIPVIERPKLIFRKNIALDIIYHQDSGYVVKSKTDSSIIGRIDIVNGKSTGIVHNLTQKDIGIITNYNDHHFKVNEIYTKKSTLWHFSEGND
jgi:hypothetical protein